MKTATTQVRYFINSESYNYEPSDLQNQFLPRECSNRSETRTNLLQLELKSSGQITIGITLKMNQVQETKLTLKRTDLKPVSKVSVLFKSPIAFECAAHKKSWRSTEHIHKTSLKSQQKETSQR